MSFFFVAFSSSSSPREDDDDDDDDDEERARTIALKRSSSFLAENTIRFSFFLSRLRDSPNALPSRRARTQKDHHHHRVRYFFGVLRGVKIPKSGTLLRHHRPTPSSSALARRRSGPPSPTTAAASAERRHHAASRMDEAQSGLLVFGFSNVFGEYQRGNDENVAKMEVLKNKAIYVCGRSPGLEECSSRPTGVLSDEMRVAESVTTC